MRELDWFPRNVSIAMEGYPDPLRHTFRHKMVSWLKSGSVMLLILPLFYNGCFKNVVVLGYVKTDAFTSLEV